MAAQPPLTHVVLAATSVADDLGYVALSDLADVLGESTTRSRRPRPRHRLPRVGSGGWIDEVHDGELGPDTGRQRDLWALIFTPVVSRYSFVWLSHRQTLEDVIAGFEADAVRRTGSAPMVRRIEPAQIEGEVLGRDGVHPCAVRAPGANPQSRPLNTDCQGRCPGCGGRGGT
jgi:hypothetical protein